VIDPQLLSFILMVATSFALGFTGKYWLYALIPPSLDYAYNLLCCLSLLTLASALLSLFHPILFFLFPVIVYLVTLGWSMGFYLLGRVLRRAIGPASHLIRKIGGWRG
jgi:hypothetical protein